MTGEPAGSHWLTVGTDSAEPEESGPAPDRIISGAPRFRTWNLEEVNGLYAGVWEATPGKWRVDYDEWEFCHVLSGISIIAEDGGEARTVQAGDSFVLSPASRGRGKCLKRLARSMW